MTVKAKATKPKKERIDVFTRKYFDCNGNIFEVGDKCEVTDDEELESLTERNAIKSVFIEV